MVTDICSAGTLIGAILATILVAAVLAPGAGPLRLAIVAGLLYGVGDAAIKAAAVGVRGHHPAGSVLGWVVLVALCTLVGFVSFQAALRKGDAIRPLTLMTAFTAIAAATLGITAFGESLGTSPAAAVLHAVAIALVLISVRPLAAAQQRLIGPDVAPGGSGVTARGFSLGLDRRPLRVARGVVTLLLGAGVLLTASAVVFGLLYSFRRLGWFSGGPRIGDALPLLQLAGFDGQPLGRILVAGLLGGLALGLPLIRLRWRATAAVAVLAVALLLFESNASYALAHNLRLGAVLASRSPGPGPWFEALLLIAGCVALKALARLPSHRDAAASSLRSGSRLRLHRAASDS